MRKFLQREFKDIGKLIWIFIKGSLVGLVVYAILSFTKIGMSYLTILFGNHWFGNYIEIVHVIFSLLGFTVSCIRDLKNYFKNFKNNL